MNYKQAEREDWIENELLKVSKTKNEPLSDVCGMLRSLKSFSTTPLLKNLVQTVISMCFFYKISYFYC
jgi:hypothetical protein